MDDFSGDYLIGLIHEALKTHVVGGVVNLNRFSYVGAGCTVFPNISIGEGYVVGAMSLVTQDMDSWSIYAGIPAMRNKDRNRNMLQFLRK